MSANFWSASEQFYETRLPLAVIAFAILLQILFFTFTYATGKRKWGLAFVFFTLTAITVGYSVWGYRHYSAYLEKAKLVTPLIRDREWKFFGYKYYSLERQDTYSDYNGLDQLMELDFYENEEVKEPLEFLGKKGYFYYFEDPDGMQFKKTKGVEFLPDSSDSYILGKRFSLKDSRFEEIGFRPSLNVFTNKSQFQKMGAFAVQGIEHFQYPSSRKTLHKLEFLNKLLYKGRYL